MPCIRPTHRRAPLAIGLIAGVLAAVATGAAPALAAPDDDRVTAGDQGGLQYPCRAGEQPPWGPPRTCPGAPAPGTPHPSGDSTAGPALPRPCAELMSYDDTCESWISLYQDEDTTSPWFPKVPGQDRTQTPADENWGLALSPTGDRAYRLGVSWALDEGRNWYVERWWLEALTTADGAKLWTKTRSGAFPIDVTLTPDGETILVTGFGVRNRFAYSITTAYAAADGSPLWETEYVPGVGAAAAPVAIAASPDGERAFISGPMRADSVSGQDYFTAAYEVASGRQLWVSRYVTPYAEGNPDRSDAPRGVAVSPDAAVVFVSGTSRGADDSAVDLDKATVAYDAETGQQLWAARHDAKQMDDRLWTPPVVSPDGARVYIAGQAMDKNLNVSWSTVAYDAATGAQLWQATYPSGGGGYRYPFAIAVNPVDGTVYVAGWHYGGSLVDLVDYLTIAYDPQTGAERWRATYGLPGYDQERALAVAVSPDGTLIYATGFSAGAIYDQQMAAVTVAYRAADGAQAWVGRYFYDTTGHNRGIAVEPGFDGKGVYVAVNVANELQSEQTNNFFDALTLAYPGTGTPGVRRPFVPRPRREEPAPPPGGGAGGGGAGASVQPGTVVGPGTVARPADRCAAARRAVTRARARMRVAGRAMTRARRAPARPRTSRTRSLRRARTDMRRSQAALRKAQAQVRRHCARKAKPRKAAPRKAKPRRARR